MLAIVRAPHTEGDGLSGPSLCADGRGVDDHIILGAFGRAAHLERCVVAQPAKIDLGQEIRKRTLEYDDVMNKQREVIYGFRNEIIHGEDVRDRLMDVMEEVVLQKTQEFSSSDEYFAFVVAGLLIMFVLQAAAAAPLFLRQELVAGTFERSLVSPMGPLLGILARWV